MARSTLPNEITVEVTQDDIDNGEPVQHDACPIARALKRQYPRRNVSVDGLTAQIGARVEYSLPSEARTFVEHFDDEKPVKPFTFIMPRA